MDKREAANKRLLTIKTKRKDQIRGTRLTPREKERIIRMHKEGWSNIQIAREIGRSDSAVSAALKRAKQ
jgi:IS30 family transposase